MDLIAPMSEGEFFERYWEKECLHSHCASPDLPSLFALNDLDTLIGHLPADAKVKLIDSMVDVNGTVLADAGMAGLSRIYEAFYSGHTIVVDSIHRFWAPVSDLCRTLTLEMGMECQANLYVTPRSNRGFRCHWDGHDVIAIQTHGTKRWRLYEPGPLLPRPNSEGSSVAVTGNPTHDIILQAGDVLYVPRGTPHEARAGDEPSAHITLGLFARTWEDLLIAAIQSTCEHDGLLRRSLPRGWNTDSGGGVFAWLDDIRARLSRALTDSNVKDAIDLLGNHIVEGALDVPDGHFSDIDLLGGIGLDTVLEKRAGNLLRISQQADAVKLTFPGGFVAGPLKLFWAFEFMRCHGAFRVDDIPGWYSDDERLMLVRLLVRKRFLRIMSLHAHQDATFATRGE